MIHTDECSVAILSNAVQELDVLLYMKGDIKVAKAKTYNLLRKATIYETSDVSVTLNDTTILFVGKVKATISIHGETAVYKSEVVLSDSRIALRMYFK